MKGEKQHKLSQGKFYRTYHHMRQRCENLKAPNYHKYGGKGVTCEWATFADFRRDMYDSYSIHIKDHGESDTTIERINSKGNYSNDNCRWATYREQNRNRSIVRTLTINGVTKILADWVAESGLKQGTFAHRIDFLGWDPIRALTTPARKWRKRNLKVNDKT